MMNWGKRRRAGLWVMLMPVLSFLVWMVMPAGHQLDVTIEAELPRGGYFEIFYVEGMAAYTAQHSVRLAGRGTVDRSVKVYDAQIRSHRPIRAIRIDPMNVGSAVALTQVTFKGRHGQEQLTAGSLMDRSKDLQQLTVHAQTRDAVRFVVSGNDPQLVILVPESVSGPSDSERWRREALALLLGGMLTCLLARAVAGHTTVRHLGLRLHRAGQRAAAWLSDDNTLVFSPGALGVYALLLMLSVIWVSLRLHQSSIGMWDERYPSEQVQRAVDLGQPRAIRSDEWRSFTPWMLSQVYRGMASDNPNLGAPGSTLLTGSPVTGPLMLAQPKFWGFALLDVQRGFSWYWASKVFGLIAALFTVLLILTRGAAMASLAGALAVYGSSFVQWWFSGNPSELITGFCAAVIGMYFLVRARKPGGMLFGAVLVGLVVPNLLMHLYPPHLLPLAHLSVFLLMGLLINEDSWRSVRERWPLRTVFMLMAVCGMVGLTALWYVEARPAIEVIMNTVYPGRRSEVGGDAPLHRVFSGVFESWKVNERPLPFADGNPTSESRMWALFPLAALIVPWRVWWTGRDKIKLVLMGFCVWVLAWTTLPLPEALRAAMALTGWYLVPSSNSTLGPGLASALLMTVLVAEIARRQWKPLALPGPMLFLGVAVAVAGYGFLLNAVDPAFFVWPRVLLAAVVVASLAWAVRSGRVVGYFLLVVLAALPTLHVNPVQSGLDSFLNKALFKSALTAGGGPKDRWAVYGDFSVAQGFKAVGLDVINGTNYAPRVDKLQLLDPQREYADDWNRYAHIELRSGVAGQAPMFELPVADQYAITLDVCGAHLRDLGVTHVVYTYPPTDAERRCLVPIPEAESDGTLFYFKLNRSFAG
jgi:hypothetical protein